MGADIEMGGERGPVTFDRPLQQKQTGKKRKMNYIITWIVRGVAFLAEVLFFLPLCVVSCSSQANCDKTVGGIGAVFGFKLKYLDDPVVGIWWFVFVFFFTAMIIALWYIKDMNRLKNMKVRRIALCFFTCVLAILNVIIMSCFIFVANARVEAANEGFAIGEVTLRFTLGFWVLYMIQILLSIGGIYATIRIYIRKYLIHKSK